MKLTIPRKELLDVLSHMQSVVERRNTLPVLANVMLRASDNILKVVATDLELEIDEEVSADVQEGGGNHRVRPFVPRYCPQDGKCYQRAVG